ncbi:MAG: hypothetical protein ABI776_03800 [Nocardioidaceae bacterium]
MNTYIKNTRYVGWTAAGVLAIATLLSWYTVSGPFIESLSVKGVRTDDGKLALGFALALAIVAIFANKMWLGICGVMAVAYYGYEFVHVFTMYFSQPGGSKSERAVANAFTTFVQKRKEAATTSEQPDVSVPR